MCMLCEKLGFGAFGGDAGGDFTSPRLVDPGRESADAGNIDNAPTFGLSQIIAQLRTSWTGTGQYGPGTYRAWFGSNFSYSIADGDTNGTRGTETIIGMTAAM